MLTLYAKVVNGVITEYPVSSKQIYNRSEDIKDYHEVVFVNIPPAVGPYEKLTEKLVIYKDTVLVEFALEKFSLESLLSLIPRHPDVSIPGDFVSEEPASELLRESVIDAVRSRVQLRLDDFAATRFYGDSVTSPSVSISTYVSSSNSKFAEEANYFVSVRDATWVALYRYLNDVDSGTAEIIRSYADLEAILPELKWPDEV